MLKKSSALFIAVLTSTGLAMAADNNDSRGLGPNPKHVTGATAASAGPTGSGGTGASATGAGASQDNTNAGAKGSAQSGQGDPSGAKYIDCPGNAFSGGIRNDTRGAGTDCVPPDSVVIQGSDNLSRDNSTSGHAVGNTSAVGSSGSAGTAATGNSTQKSAGTGGASGGNNTGNAGNKNSGSPAEKVEKGGSSLR